MKEALYYKKEDGKLLCLLCPNYCLLADGKRGLCKARINDGGKLYSEIYERVTSVSLDPIEKKPLYHFHPGQRILSLGTKGCNFACPWCQNWSISQDVNARTERMTSGEVLKKIQELQSFGAAYTYNEPFIWYEFVIECCKKLHEHGLKNVFVTNAYINAEPFDEIFHISMQ